MQKAFALVLVETDSEPSEKKIKNKMEKITQDKKERPLIIWTMTGSLSIYLGIDMRWICGFKSGHSYILNLEPGMSIL